MQNILSSLLKVTSVYAADVVGTITAPQTIVRKTTDTGPFLGVVIRFIIVIAGVWSLWQILTGGLGFITSNGDKAKVQESTQKILMAILGLAIIGASFILTAVVGRLLFGSSFNILSPTLQSVK